MLLLYLYSIIIFISTAKAESPPGSTSVGFLSSFQDSRLAALNHGYCSIAGSISQRVVVMPSVSSIAPSPSIESWAPSKILKTTFWFSGRGSPSPGPILFLIPAIDCFFNSALPPYPHPLARSFVVSINRGASGCGIVSIATFRGVLGSIQRTSAVIGKCLVWVRFFKGATPTARAN